MTYTAPGAKTFRLTGGDLDKKICAELAKIDTEIDSAEANITTLTGNRVRYAVVNLTAGNANAFMLAWQNPIGGTILIQRLCVYISTPGGTATAVGDFGTGATATTASDNLIDGCDMNATALYNNITDKGTNGKTSQVLATGQYITGQILTANAAALVGKAIINYIPL